jgi:hypothetical protein
MNFSDLRMKEDIGHDSSEEKLYANALKTGKQ